MLRTGRRTGFTMIEVLVAAAVSATLLGALYSLWSGGVRLNRDSEAKSEALQSATLALAAIGGDVRRIVTLPIERDASGRIVNTGGNHLSPVSVSPGGKNISFYVPSEAKGLDAARVSYRLSAAPAGGLYFVERVESAGDEEETTRAVHGVVVKELQFRLRDPRDLNPMERSPDDGYYLEAKVVGSDATGRDAVTLSSLWQIDAASVRQRAATRNVADDVHYASKVPLAADPDVVNYTEAEAATLDKMRDLAQRHEKGDIKPAELEKEVAQLLDGLAGRPGRNPMWMSPDRATLPPVKSVKLVSNDPGKPLEVETDGGDRVVIPTRPGPLYQRLGDEARKPSGRGSGQVTFTMTFQEQRWVNGRLVGSRSHAAGGGIDYAADGTTDLQGARDQAMAAGQGQISDFFRRYGLPPPQF